MRRGDLVVSIGADEQQMPHVRVRGEMLQELQRRGVQPPEVVEEQHERMLGPREDANEPADCGLEARLRLRGRQLGDRRLFSDDKLKFRNEVNDKLAVGAKHLPNGLSPSGEFCVALAQNRADEALEGLGQGGVRDIALVLVELTGGEQAARWNERLVQLVEDRGLADARISGTSTSSGVPCATTRSKAMSRASISRSRPYSFSGIRS